MNDTHFDLAAYDYELPASAIAQAPAAGRDESRLLVLSGGGSLADRRFGDILEYLAAGDLLVVNNTRVFPARLLGRKETGGRVELFILEYPRKPAAAHQELAGHWQQVEVVGLVKSSKRPRPGMVLHFGSRLTGKVVELLAEGRVRVELAFQGEFGEVLAEYGHVPLPPYIARQGEEAGVDRERYQTVYASQTGAVAAPTAGLHFTPELLARVKAKGVGLAEVTLHVGYGTFAPVRATDIRQHRIHQEYVTVSRKTADQINETVAGKGRVWAVGTTTLRTLEFAADDQGLVQPVEGWCELYIYPGYRFKVVHNLITNFHLPRSSLLFLVSALAGRQRVLAAYRHAVEQGYRFYSYGDAMAIVEDG